MQRKIVITIRTSKPELNIIVDVPGSVLLLNN